MKEVITRKKMIIGEKTVLVTFMVVSNLITRIPEKHFFQKSALQDQKYYNNRD